MFSGNSLHSSILPPPIYNPGYAYGNKGVSIDEVKPSLQTLRSCISYVGLLNTLRHKLLCGVEDMFV